MDRGNGETRVPVFILGLRSLLKNKAATARAEDLNDLRCLRQRAWDGAWPDFSLSFETSGPRYPSVQVVAHAAVVL